MTKPVCMICGNSETDVLDIDSFIFSTVSYLPEFHQYKNLVCGGCGVVFGVPQIPMEKLAEFYNSGYWQALNNEELTYEDHTVEAPINFANSVVSLQRAKNFFTAIDRAAERTPGAVPQAGDLAIDYGAFQGLFLHALRSRYAIRGIPFDYNQAGITFARTMLGFDEARVTEDILTDVFGERAKFVTMVHFFEHVHDPMGLLAHIRESVLAPGGFLYIEVPNLYGHPISDPFHFFTFSEESMGHVMARSGFEIVEMFTNTWPRSNDAPWANDDQNLVCLARPADGVSIPPAVDTATVHRNIRRSYARISAHAVGAMLKSAFRWFARLLYNFTFAVVLERISPALMIKLARALKFRRPADE